MTLVFHGRFPGEKAGALFAAKSAEAFANAGFEVELLVPFRRDRVQKNAHEYWGIKRNFSTRYLPAFDFYRVRFLAPAAFLAGFISFTLSVFIYLLRHRERSDIVYSNEMFPLLLASFISKRTVLEVHDYPGKGRLLWGVALRRMHLIVATNSWKAEALQKEFGAPRERVLIEQNAVDMEMFSHSLFQAEARSLLSLPEEKRIVLYTGYLYAWKGVDTLAKAATYVPDALFYIVGGTGGELEAFKKRYASAENVRVIGHRPYRQIPLWQKAADVVVLPNSAREPISERYTSPMKLFEYMASGTPIVASDLPSVREIVDDDSVWFSEPDDARMLADTIRKVIDSPDEARRRAARGRERAKGHSWEARAARVIAAIERVKNRW